MGRKRKFHEVFLAFFADGGTSLRVVMPVLSAAYLGLKVYADATGRNDMTWLQNLSYAWALAPLLIWALAAYWGRYSAYLDLENVADVAAAQREHTEAIKAQTEEIRRSRNPTTAVFDSARRAQLERFLPKPPHFSLSVDEKGPYQRVNPAMPYRRERSLKLCVENVEPQKAARGCRAQVLEIEPYAGSHGPWLLKEPFDLPAGDKEYILLATYGERVESNPNSSADSFFQINVLDRTAPALGIDSEHILTIQVTALDAPPEKLKCRLWVDSDGHLRVAKV